MKTRKRPNVVIFFTDQQRWDSSGLHGNPLNLMPTFDRFARAHTHVAQSFTCQPVCGPARACLQTGQYATTNGAVDNNYPLPKDRPTLATCFNDAGYRTAYFGKWHLAAGPIGPVEPEDRGGYRDWLASNILEFTSTPYQTTLYNNESELVELFGYRPDVMTDAAIRYIVEHRKERPDQPFMASPVDQTVSRPHPGRAAGAVRPRVGGEDRHQRPVAAIGQARFEL
ncbi:sulfatase-like hydrolase/transferase [Puniceicoccus vermicola]|uniref:sulfatase-like hydrolase/transferase n=1 Tax=Puniceicoccus vermicola TaxID=388746 RepID=UPI001C8C8372|nr:sulfatase-like hydrolase/transferase [Puniceicoccus vermicola]